MKNIDAMFQDVPKGYLLKAGDVIMWPGERGKVMHLHGSASTFRELGASIGNRWRATSHENLKTMFQSEPERPRLFIVTEVLASSTEMNDSAVMRATLFSSSMNPVYTGPRTEHVNIMELPTKFDDTTRTRLMALADSAGELLDPHAPGLTEINMTTPANRELAEVFDFFNRSLSYDLNENHLVWPGDDGSFGPFHPCRFVYQALKHCPPDGGRWPVQASGDKFTASVPTVMMDNAAKYGVRMYRPTEAFMKAYMSALCGYAAECLAVHRTQLVAMLTPVARKIMDQLKTCSGGVSRCKYRAKSLNSAWKSETRGLDELMEKGIIK